MTWRMTERETAKGKMAPGSMAAPKRRSGSAVDSANDWIYGPSRAVTTVVLKAELAQSYIIQPVISRLSFNSTLPGKREQ